MSDAAPRLRRVLSLPWLVFYGVGVTIGAGIFALIAEIVGVAGDHAPWSFLAAGFVAGFAGFAYALLAREFPRAAGEAVFVMNGLGTLAGRLTGLAAIAVAITSSAVIGLAFARYVESFSGLPQTVSFVAVIAVLAGVAAIGVRESVAFAALITVLEAGTLILVIAAGLPAAVTSEALPRVLTPPSDWAGWSAALSGGFIAFFAFIGFEDIENLAEETRDAPRTIPLAIILTLLISVAIYAAVAVVAATHADRAGLVASEAPLSDLFAAVTGWPGAPVAVMASVAMVNGILVQIVTSSRIVYGMAREGMLPDALAAVDGGRGTPLRAIGIVAASILLLGLLVPLLRLAEATSLVVLLIFAAVNFSLYVIGRQSGAPRRLARWRFLGLGGAAASLGLAAAQVMS